MTTTSRPPRLPAPAGAIALSYDPLPRYDVANGQVVAGWDAAVATLPAGVAALAVDGPAVLDWAAVEGALITALSNFAPISAVIMQDAARPWDEILARTSSPRLADDPDFATLASGRLADLLDLDLLAPPREGTPGLRLLLGPGAALTNPDVLWWADLPKRYAEDAVTRGLGRNLAQPAGMPATSKRLFYVDWPLLDRHRDEFAPRVDRWIDTQDVRAPASISGTALRATCAELAHRPFRTRPTFNSTPWGGHWAQRALDFNTDQPNTALGYELIAPESGVLLGDEAGALLEVPFQLLVALAPQEILGPVVHEMFGTSFPIRFDYLDTVDGGNLSLHCHPRTDYMRDVFGWPYTQHETYYVMVGSEGSEVFLGLRDDASVDEFHRLAHEADRHGVEFDIERFVQTFPADPHQLFLVPAGTPHASSEGNVVLEVSATPYLYSLRFYDWLRSDAADHQRAVHVEHAFRNLDRTRSGAAVADRLVQSPRPVTQADGWREELIGALPEMFFEVHRIVIDAAGQAEQDTGGRFHVMTVVEGDGVVVEAAAGDHRLNYAETLAVPASVGRYRIRNTGARTVRLVTAFVR